MEVNSKSIWQPDTTFLQRGSELFFAQEPQRIEWVFSKKSLPLLQTEIQCRISGFGLTAAGSSTHFSLDKAVRTAFAESWERLWYARVKSGQVTLPFSVVSTNGFAAGTSAEDAARRARCELIERAAVLVSWRDCLPGRPHSSLVFPLNLAPSYLRTRGWRLELGAIEVEELGTVLYGFAQHRIEGTVFDSIHAKADPQPEKKLLLSLLRMLSRPGNSIALLPDEAGPQDQGSYYRDPTHNRAFHFLRRSVSERTPLRLPEPAHVQTVPLVSNGLFPAVTVAYHPNWPELTWGKQSIQGKNDWPHPVA